MSAEPRPLYWSVRRELWETDDEVWWRPGRALTYVPFTPADADALREQFAAAGRAHVLEAM